MLCGVIAAVVLAVSSNVCQAAFVVAKGYDLFQNLRRTTFFGRTFKGCPSLGFDFNGNFVEFGNSGTSMIVNRLQGARSDSRTTINVRIDYFKVKSTAQFNYQGNGKAFYVVTLKPRNEAQSKGKYTIRFNEDGKGGTFDARIVLNYAIYKAGGARVGGGTTLLVANNVAWGRTGPAAFDTWYLRGINSFFKGGNSHAYDFFAKDNFTFTHGVGSGGKLVCFPAASPSNL
jgi:hypothetical protein